MEHDHDPASIRARLAVGPRHSYLRDLVYGGIDGAVTTFAVVAGVTGAALPSTVVVVMGAANLVADGFSMAASDWSGTRAERAEHARARAVEQRHVALDPDGEREEVRQLLMRDGFVGTDLERAVQVVTEDRERWIRMMLREEYGLAHAVRSPNRAALITFAAFLVCGSVPLVPYVLGLPRAFPLSIAFTGCVFFLIGSLRGRVTRTPALQAGLETLALGGSAAALAWIVGRLLATYAAA